MEERESTLQEREAKQRRCNSWSHKQRGRGGEGRVLMEGDIGRSHIRTCLKKVHSIALLHARGIGNKYAFKSERGDEKILCGHAKYTFSCQNNF